MSTGTKVAIGVGAAAVAAGGLFFAKKMYDKHQAKPPSTQPYPTATKEIVPNELHPFMDFEHDPADQNNKFEIAVPNTLSLGLGWAGESVNLDLISSAFDSHKKLIGFIQGSANRRLFDGGLWHSGDDTSGGSAGKFSSVSGDNENIVVDFRKVPSNVNSIVVGVYLSHTVDLSKCYVRLLPLLTPENVGVDPAAMLANTSPEHDTVSADHDPSDKNEFFTSFYADLDGYSTFAHQRGFVCGRFSRSSSPSGWSFTPIREVVDVDAQYGLFPVLERFA